MLTLILSYVAKKHPNEDLMDLTPMTLILDALYVIPFVIILISFLVC